LLISAFLFGYAIFQIPTGVIADRYGRKRSLYFGLILVSIFAYFFSNTSSLYYAVIFRFLMGAGSASVYTSCFGLIVEITKKDERGTIYGFYEASAGVGMSFATLGLPLLSTFIGLTFVFIATSFLSSIMLFFLFIVPSSRKKISKQYQFSFIALSRVVRKLRFWHLCSLGVLGFFCMYGALTWLPTYLNVGLGYTSVQAGGVTAVVYILLTFLSPFAGKISDITCKRTIVTALGSFIMVGAFLMLLLFHDIQYIIVACGLLGAAIAFSMPPFLSLSTELFNKAVISTVIGTLLMFGQISSALSTYTFGYVIGISNTFSLVWLISCLLALIRVILALLLKEK